MTAGFGAILAAWLSSMVWSQASAAPPADDPAALGRALYLGHARWSNGAQATSNALPAEFSACARCHGPTGEGGREGGQVVPPLSWQRLTTAASGSPAYADDKAIVAAVERGIGRGGNRLNGLMPRFRLNRADRRALLAYLRILGTAADQPPGVTAKAVRIGVPIPLDGDGGSIGRAIRQGLEEAVAPVNRRGGVHGRIVDLVFQPVPLAAEPARQATRRFIETADVFALAAGLAGDEPESSAADGVEHMLRSRRMSHIAALTPTVHPAELDDGWTAPLLPSLQDQYATLASAVRRLCPQASTEWVVGDAGHLVPASEATASERFDTIERLLDRIGQQSAHVPRIVLAERRPAGRPAMAALSSQAASGCLGHLPTQTGVIALPQGWQQIGVQPVPPSLFQRAARDHQSIWRVIGHTAGQILVEALAEAGPRLHERALLEALPKLNGRELQPGLRVFFERERLHGFLPAVTEAPRRSTAAASPDSSADFNVHSSLGD